MRVVVDKIEKSLKKKYPKVKFETIYDEIDNEYFICVDKIFIDSKDGNKWLSWAEKICDEVGITNIYIIDLTQ